MCAIYRELYGDACLWLRPLSMLLRKDDKEKYPNAPQEHRFELQDILWMRNFYRTYGESFELMELAMEISWTQNVVI